MVKRFYISKLVNGTEFVLCNFVTGMEFVASTDEATINGFQYVTDDDWLAEEAAHINGGSVEEFVQ